MTKKYTTQEYKKAYIDKWGNNQYDLSKIDYTFAHSNIEVYCNIHKIFFKIKAYSFLQGKGCSKCANVKKLTPEIFKIKGENVHGVGSYGYDNITDIKNNKTKVPIKCLKVYEHGIFWQTPNDHLRNHGCPKCAGVFKLSWHEILNRFNVIHDNFFDYSLNKESDIKNTKTIIKITCPKHGLFQQSIDCHLNKQGCLECHKENHWLTPEQFEQKANKLHNNFFNYTLAKQHWKNTYTKVEIICPIHGSFWQLPKNHLKKHGCPNCSCAKTRISKNQKKLYDILKNQYLHERIELEYFIKTKNKKCHTDICFVDKNIIIEYYGDYWHCNPSKYKADYFHKNYKMTAKDIWERDSDRKQELEKLGYKVIIVWEKNWVDNEDSVKKWLINEIDLRKKI